MRKSAVVLDVPTSVGAVAIGIAVTAYVALRVDLDALSGTKLWMVVLLGPALVVLGIDHLRRNHKASHLARTATRTKIVAGAVAIAGFVLTWVGLAVAGFPG